MSEVIHNLAGSTVLVTGATGMIGRRLVETLIERDDVTIVVTGRSLDRLLRRFGKYRQVRYDLPKQVDYIFHLASNTHPKAYAEDPIGTIDCNVMMTRKWLDYAVSASCKRFVFASSVEVYGQNRGDVELFDETYCGYIDSNTLRAGYPESKRCGEALCQAYLKQKGLDVVIPRIARVYGPTLQKTDTKALSQFFANALRGEDIVLKSEGTQYFSYLHVDDVVSGLLTILQRGAVGGAYNIADPRSDIRLRDLARLIAESAGRKVVFDLPDAVEKAGFSTATVARLDATKLRDLGWSAQYDIESGVRETMTALRNEWALS